MKKKCEFFTLRPVLATFVFAFIFLGLSERYLWSSANIHEPISVGMVALLAAPQKYNGKVIQTWGILNLRSDGNGLWFHRDDLDFALWKDSLQLELTEEQEKQFKNLNQTYVMVVGVMRSNGPEGRALNSGTLSHISLVQGWSPFVPSQPSKK